MTKYGRNELVEKGGRTPLKILWEQLTATMVLILIAAAVVAGLLGDLKNTIAISAIVILYAILGFVQEYRAEQAIAALKKLSVPNVRVLRDKTLKEISARDLVPGDVIQLEAGNVLPADVRLLEAVNLRIQEAALTGESEPVEKQIATLSGDGLPLGDRRNMGYMGTTLAEPILSDLGLELVDAEFRREAHGWVLRLYMDRPGGVTLAYCQRVSEELGDHLDVEDFIGYPYHLEVSSPGLDRPLTRDQDFVRYAGQEARVSTREELQGRRNFRGRLAGLQDGAVLLDLPDGQRVLIPRELILRARLQPDL